MRKSPKPLKDSEARKRFKSRLSEVRKIAKKYERRGHFQQQDRAAYHWAYDAGVLDDVCSHMKGKHKEVIWTKEKIKDVAAKHERRVDFQKKDKVAYMAAYNNGWLDEVCKHMPKPNSWFSKNLKLEDIKVLVLSYEKISKFQKENMGAYYALARSGKYQEVKQMHKDFYGDHSDR